METKHTPGPWEVDEAAQKIIKRRVIPEYCDEAILLLPSPLDDTDWPAIVADAHMASAAPELFAALQAFAGVEDFAGWHDKYSDAIRLARAAIAKATGA